MAADHKQIGRGSESGHSDMILVASRERRKCNHRIPVGVLMAGMDQAMAEALAHHEAGRLREAEQLYRRVLAADPQNADALHLLGLVAHQAGRSDVAVTLIGRAIAQRGDIPAFHNNLGEALRRLGRLGDAIASYQQALALDPQFAEAHNNLGTVHHQQGWLEGAVACYERAIACRSNYANPHYNRARAWLAQGDFARGWEEYEWRWQRPEFYRNHLDQPAWDGAPLEGRTLLVRWEQGLGDTLHYVRYVRLLESAGQRVIAEVQPALVGLLRASGFAHLVASGEPAPPFDVQAMLLSLPHLLGTTLQTIPASIPYLSVSPPLVEKWRQRLASTEGAFKIGIHWQGYQHSPLEPWRSMPLAAFEPLSRVQGVELISLQKGFGTEQIPNQAFNVIDWSAEIDQTEGPFMDTAALMRQLDLVVTSDSATAHLAGALGVEVWVALSVSADYRWLQKRSDSPWYPTMRLFRQRELGNWTDVFEEIQRTLADAVKRKADNA